MKKEKNPYHFFNNYVLRTPVLPFNNYLNSTKDIKINDAYLLQLWKNAFIKESIFLASPQLYYQLDDLFVKEKGNSLKEEKLKHAFLKYVIRASTRCTPFGLFAGVCMGYFDTNEAIELKEHGNYRRKTRLDMNYLVALFKALNNDVTIKEQLLFYPNSSLYEIANQYRYIEYQLENLKRVYSLEAIENSTYIKTIIEASKKGKTINELATLLVDEDITTTDAKDFINDLIQNQILVSELQCSLSDEDLLTQLLTNLNKLDDCNATCALINKLQKAILSLDKTITNPVEDYNKVYTILDAIGVEYDTKYVLQTDLFTTAKKNTLNTKKGYELQKIIGFLNTIRPYEEHENLKSFKKAFKARYEDREVDLVKVLDIETGIGYLQNNAVSDTVPFLSDIIPTPKKETQTTLALTSADEIIYNKLIVALANNSYTMELLDHDFSEIESSWETAPDVVSALLEVGSINDKEYLSLNAVGGTNGANLLARFGYGDEALAKHIEEVSEFEKQANPNKLLVEIMHLPEARTGNVLRRPKVRAYELPYLAKSNRPINKQININDLLICIEKNRIVLKSKTHKKEISPRLTNAHNYSKKGLPIYHFLCDLQTQDKKTSLNFSWKGLSQKHAFLPRVYYKNCILSKAKWIITIKSINALLLNYTNEKELPETVSKWRKDHKIPQHVQLKESDNTLLIDLEQVTMIQLLLSTVKNQEQFTIEEFLFTEQNVVNRGTHSFTNQFVVSFYNKAKVSNLKKIV